MKKFIFTLTAIALLTGCGSTIRTGSIINGKRYRPTNPNQIRIFSSEKTAPNNYKEIGLIVSHTKVYVPFILIGLDTTVSMLVAAGNAPDNANYRSRPVFRELIYKAADLGANAVIIKNFYKRGVWKTITAVAIRTQTAESAPKN